MVHIVSPSTIATACPCCGSTAGTKFEPVMWPELGRIWELSEEEYRYIDRQQGEKCAGCGSNLRSQVLALAILRWAGARGPLARFLRTARGRWLRVLEINTAGSLTWFFARRSRHVLMSYPDLDMMDMAIPDGRYDLVIHSETLEHVPDPMRALRECLRVLRPGGACCYTVPTVVGRITRTTEGREPSYHGRDGENLEDFRVQTEYGADAWRQILDAGFAEARIVAIAAPCAYAYTGIKGA